ncbi:MAG: uracil-DNA glycosylase, partial [Oscillospiraceae bacterium]
IIRQDFKISQEHGQWTEKNGIKMMALYHPAALLRDPRRKPETFEDLKELQRVIREVCDHTYA